MSCRGKGLHQEEISQEIVPAQSERTKPRDDRVKLKKTLVAEVIRRCTTRAKKIEK